MEKKALTAAMKNSISEVLETMFFLPIGFSESVATLRDLWTGEGPDAAVAKLDFEGPLTGHFIFLIPVALAREMTADFLGKDDHRITQDQIGDTVKEILNMVAGNTFSHFDDRSVFNLGIPEIVHDGEILHQAHDSNQEVFIAVNTTNNILAFQMVIGA